MIKCSICCRNKTEKNFSYRNKVNNKKQSQCKECLSKKNKDHYLTNKKYYCEKARRSYKSSYERNQAIICDYLLKHPCVDCGETDIVVLEFDHKQNKKFAISLISNKSVKKLLGEISKCEIRCANCHRRKTAKQFGYFRINYKSLLDNGKSTSFRTRNSEGSIPFKDTL